MLLPQASQNLLSGSTFGTTRQTDNIEARPALSTEARPFTVFCLTTGAPHFHGPQLFSDSPLASSQSAQIFLAGSLGSGNPWRPSDCASAASGQLELLTLGKDCC